MLSTLRFLWYGRSNFTRTGWERSRRRNPNYENDPIGPDADRTSSNREALLGRNYVVTGASSGIGKELTCLLASKSATVFMVVRSQEKGEDVKREIAQRMRNQLGSFDETKLVLVMGNMSLEGDVRRVCQEIEQKVPHVDGVVCNAGALLNTRTITAEGVETTWATHLMFGYYLLGNLLLPLLEKSSLESPRLVFVTSGGSLIVKLPDWDTASGKSGKYDGVQAYSFAKRAEIVLAERMAMDHRQKGKTQICTAHPGWTQTPGVDEAFGSSKILFQPMRSVYQGAEGIAWLVAFATRDQVESGGLYLDRMSQPKHLSESTKSSNQDIDEFMSRLAKEVPLSR